MVPEFKPLISTPETFAEIEKMDIPPLEKEFLTAVYTAPVYAQEFIWYLSDRDLPRDQVNETLTWLDEVRRLVENGDESIVECLKDKDAPPLLLHVLSKMKYIQLV